MVAVVGIFWGGFGIRNWFETFNILLCNFAINCAVQIPVGLDLLRLTEPPCREAPLRGVTINRRRILLHLQCIDQVRPSRAVVSSRCQSRTEHSRLATTFIFKAASQAIRSDFSAGSSAAALPSHLFYALAASVITTFSAQLLSKCHEEHRDCLPLCKQRRAAEFKQSEGHFLSKRKSTR
jgi:hypothetical protein